MSWSYSKDPSTSTLDQVRFYVGDTNDDAHQFENEELAWLLSEHGDDPKQAALDAVSRLVAKYSRLVDKTVGDLKISSQQQFEHFLSVKNDLIDATGGSFATPVAYAGGISVGDMELQRGNTDRVAPLFDIGQDDYEKSQILRDPRVDPENPI